MDDVGRGDEKRERDTLAALTSAWTQNSGDQPPAECRSTLIAFVNLVRYRSRNSVNTSIVGPGGCQRRR